MSTTVVRGHDGITRVNYCDTAIVEFDARYTTLDSAGHRTRATQIRMNQASNQFNLGYHVYQDNYTWYVRIGKKKFPFYDGMIVDRIIKAVVKERKYA